MKDFRCLVGVRHPPAALAGAVRDLIYEIGPSLESVEQIATVSRLERPDGVIELVNEWRINPALPSALDGIVTRDMLGWLDHAEWSSNLTECDWRVEPFFMGEAIRCRGATRFEQAMGGRGTRAVFEGQLDIDPSALASLQPAWRAPASLAIEFIIGTLIPRNFRKTVEAVSDLLEARSFSRPGRRDESPAADRPSPTGQARTPAGPASARAAAPDSTDSHRP
jgi:hypothetical protein